MPFSNPLQLTLYHAMRCFITGANGFIGSAVAGLLLTRGHTVSGLTSSQAGLKPLRSKGIEPVSGDIRQPDHWIDHVRDAEVVIHLATLPIPARPGSRYVRELLQAQQTVTRRMLSALSSQCKAFIYTSGISVYGSRPGIHDENVALDPHRIAEPYAAGERLTLDAFKENGAPVMVLRPAGVYGSGGVFGRFWSGPMMKGKRAGIPGKGDQLFSFVHIDDCANAFVHCAENPRSGEVFNIADDEPVPLGEMIRFLAKAMNAPAPFVIPAVLFNLLAGPLVGELLLCSKAASNRKMKAMLSMDLKYPTYREGVLAFAKDARNTVS